MEITRFVRADEAAEHAREAGRECDQTRAVPGQREAENDGHHCERDRIARMAVKAVRDQSRRWPIGQNRRVRARELPDLRGGGEGGREAGTVAEDAPHRASSGVLEQH